MEYIRGRVEKSCDGYMYTPIVRIAKYWVRCYIGRFRVASVKFAEWCDVEEYKALIQTTSTSRVRFYVRSMDKPGDITHA